LGIHLLLGSMVERGPAAQPGEHGRVELRRSFNTSLLFGPDGRRLAAYRKIHRFDVDLPPDVVFRESDAVLPGTDPVTVATSLGRLGLSICYDLRFGELYRSLVDRGAEILAVPSAFTARTGRAHWRVLLRARAIENQCWVLAPAQVGRHDDGGIRHSYGHSMIVDPWGEIVAEVDEDAPGFAIAKIDPARVAEVRRAMPVREHRRL
jgi:predicted amidohydrolase